MSVTTSPRTAETPPAGAGAGYGDLDNRRGAPGGGRHWGLLAIALVVLLGLGLAALSLFSGGDDAPAAQSTTTSTISTTIPASTATTSEQATSSQPRPTDEPIEVEVGGWVLSNETSDLPQYTSSALYYEQGTPEGDIEVGFVNSEIASIRALANPGTEEPEVSFWKTGFTLRAIRDVQGILEEDGQILLPGSLTRIEIENITVRSETEADVEYCRLFHDFSVVVSDPDDTIETIETRHAINRMTLGPDGQWQNSELVSEIQVVEGFGACLDVELTPVS